MQKWLPLVVLAVVLGFLVYGKVGAPDRQTDQIALAKETRKAMDAMMADFREAKASTIEGVPADGKWYHTVAFDRGSQGTIRYEVTPASHELRRLASGSDQTVAHSMDVLNVRRQAGAADIFEVQLQAKNKSVLISNFRIRSRN